MAVERWTDKMLDELAFSVSKEKESITELREGLSEVKDSVTELRESVTELREGLSEVKDGVDGLRVTTQALLQVAAQSQRDMELLKQRQIENDQRFNVLLEEVRFLIRNQYPNQ